MPEFIRDDWFMMEGDVRAAFIIFGLTDIVNCNQSHTAHNIYRAMLLARALVEKLVDHRVQHESVMGMIVNPSRRTWEVLVVHPVFPRCMPTADVPAYLPRDARNMIFAYEEAASAAPEDADSSLVQIIGPRRVIF